MSRCLGVVWVVDPVTGARHECFLTIPNTPRPVNPESEQT